MTPFSLPTFIKFLLGVLLLQGATVLLVMTAQNADLQKSGWLIVSLGILIGVIAAFWFTAITSHANQRSFTKASEKFNRQRDYLRRQAEKEKTREIRNSHEQILRDVEDRAGTGRCRRPGGDTAVHPVHDAGPAGRLRDRWGHTGLWLACTPVPGNQPGAGCCREPAGSVSGQAACNRG
jgi:hypothetical protein